MNSTSTGKAAERLSRYEKSNRKQGKKYDIDWSFYRDISVLDVYRDVIGLSESNGDIVRNGSSVKIRCQSKNHSGYDKNPSVSIKNNKCTCFSCKSPSNGSALDVIMTTYDVPLFEAALILDKYYPGGIKEIDNSQEEENIKIPDYDLNFYKEIGLVKSPFYSTMIRLKNLNDLSEKSTAIYEEYVISMESAALLIIDKIHERENFLRKELAYTRSTYSSITNEVYAGMRREVINQISSLEEKVSELREFVRELGEHKEETMGSELQPWLE